MKQTRSDMIELDLFWGRQQLFYDGSNRVIYYCRNYDQAADDDNTEWLIWRYSYTGDNLVDVQRLKGTVTGRAALAWV